MKKQKKSFWRMFSYVLLIGAILPFLLRLGLDLDGVNRQALKKIYYEWKWTELNKSFKGTDTVIYKRSDRRDRFEDFFVTELQKDFKVVEVGDFPELRAFFEKERTLRARIEWRKNPTDADWKIWEGEARFPNNGLLLGFWIALIFFFLGRSPRFVISISLFFMLAWQARWNLLSIPWVILEPFFEAYREMGWRVTQKDWVGWDYGSLPFIISVVWFCLASAFQNRFVRRILSPAKRYGLVLAGSFLVEPFAIWLGSHLVPWSPDASWWKVYLGSFAFRFVTFAFFFSLLIRAPDEGQRLDSQRKGRFERLSLFLVPVFLIAGGRSWLQAVLIVDSGSALLHLKVFITSMILGALLGSRIFSVFFGLLVLCFVALPTQGHFDAAATFGFFMDGVLVGWWLSPMKGEFPILPFPERKNDFLLSACVGWTLGVFLWAAGVPLPICWIGVFLATWSYGQLKLRGGRRLTEVEALD